jgi:hypothetical protein
MKQGRRKFRPTGAIVHSSHGVGKTKLAQVQIPAEGLELSTSSGIEHHTFVRAICGRNESVDPFGCTSIPITKTVHQLLLFFDSLWYPRTLIRPDFSASFTSSGHKVMQECIFDPLQMNAVLASMSSRLENFHNQSIVGGSKQFIDSAIGILHQNLADNTHLTGKHIYAIMKLYSAEAYRGDI